MSKKLYAQLATILHQAMEEDIGLKIETNDSARLVIEFNHCRRKLREEGSYEFDLLKIRKVKIAGESSEQVYLTKTLTPEQVVAVMRREKQQENQSS